MKSITAFRNMKKMQKFRVQTLRLASFNMSRLDLSCSDEELNNVIALARRVLLDKCQESLENFVDNRFLLLSRAIRECSSNQWFRPHSIGCSEGSGKLAS